MAGQTPCSQRTCKSDVYQLGLQLLLSSYSIPPMASENAKALDQWLASPAR